METDAKNPEEEQEDASSVEEQNPSEASEGEKTPEEEGTVPYERFQEVIQDKNKLKEDIETLKEDIESLKTAKEPEEENEPDDWKDAESRTVKKAVEVIKSDMKKESEAEIANEKVIEKSFSHLTKMGEKITPDVKRTVLTEMIKTGNNDVLDIYLGLKGKLADKAKVEQQKKEGYVPPSRKGSEADVPAFDYKDVKGKSIDDIIEDSGL